MAEERGIRRFVRLILDRPSAQKVQEDMTETMARAGELGGQAFLREIRSEFDSKMAELRHRLSKGIISEEEFRREADAAARAFNTKLSAAIDELRAKGQLTDREFQRLGRQFKRTGEEGAVAFDRMRGMAVRLGGAIAAAFSIRAIFGFGRDSTRMALEADAVWNRLGGTLRGVGVDLEDVRTDLEHAARALQDTTTIDDEGFADTLQRLVSISRNYSASLQNVGLVADVAAGAHIDLESAAQLVGRAMVGDTAMLRRYGIIVREGGDAIAAMRQQFAGMAQNEARDLAGQTEQLKNEWGDFREVIGGIIAGSGGGIVSILTGQIRDLTGSLDENSSSIARWVSTAAQILVAITRTLWAPVRIIFEVGETLGHLARIVFADLQFLITEGVNQLLAGANFTIRQLNRIPGVDIDFRFNRMNSEAFLEEISEQFAAIQSDGDDIVRAIEGIGEAWAQVALTAEGAARAQRRALPAGLVPPAGGGGGDSSMDGLPLPLTGVIEPLTDLRRGMGGAVSIRPTTYDPEIIAAFAERWREEHAAMESVATNFAHGVAAAWQDAFAIMFDGMEDMSDVAEALGRGMAAALLGGLAQFASGKVAENIAQAFEQVALGSGRAALGDLIGAGGHYKAAAEHGVAAAAWGVLAGGAAAGQGAVSGGGASGRSGGLQSGAFDPAGRVADGLEQRGAETHIYIDPIDPNNPVHQREIGRLVRNAAERGHVTVHRGAR